VKRRWCENLAATLGLRRVWVKHINNPAASVRIAIDGVVEPLTDPRVSKPRWERRA